MAEDKPTTGRVERRPPRETDLAGETWFVDPETGQPMIKIGMQVSELIGLPKFSNVTVGPARIEMFVAKGQEEVLTAEERTALGGCVNSLANVIEQVLINHRGKVLGDLKEHYRKEGDNLP